jgi:hypothetical protein
LTVAIISRWDYRPSGDDLTDHQRLVSRLRKQAPEVVNEWPVKPSEQVGPKQHLRKHGVPLPDGAGVAKIGPFTIRQLNLFAHKVVLALYFEHFKMPLGVNGAVCAYWRSKEDFARDGIPTSVRDFLPGYATLLQGKWDESKTFDYRHNSNPNEGLFGRFSRLRGRFFAGGFVLADPSTLPDHDEDWVSPADPAVLLDSLRFQRKL